MPEELEDTSSLENSIMQQPGVNESIEQALEDSENRRKEEGGFGVEKPISVIFAAIEGFEVDSNADMDMIEEISIVKQQFDLELDNIITKYGGITDKIQGSFFMATFGTQVTNKDDPTCAVLAAMDMVKITDKFPDAARAAEALEGWPKHWKHARERSSLPSPASAPSPGLLGGPQGVGWPVSTV